jgi:putative ABC transport system permease protein
MSRIFWILTTLLSHWLRHPVQLAAFAIGLMSATALWSGVQAINLHARASYDRAASAIGGDNGVMLVPTYGQDVPQSIFADLRRAGWLVSPVVEGRVRVRDRQIRLIGIEPVSLPHSAGLAPSMTDTKLQPFLSSEGQTLVAPETAAELGLIEGATISTEAGVSLPPIRIAGQAPPDVLVMDIGRAQRLLNKADRVSRFIVDPEKGSPRIPLVDVVGDRLKLVQNEDRSDLQRLTASFHLNLTAFGFLSFVVGLFITHSAIGLVCEQRLATIRTLRACGVSLRAVIMVMLVELLVLSAAAGAAGLIGGYLIARLLLPDIAASLRGLYGAGVSSRLLVSPQWWTVGMAVAMAGALVAAMHSFYRVYRLPVLVSAQPYAWQREQRRWRIGQSVLACAALIVSGASLVYGEGLVAGFVVLGGVMIAAALLLPVVLGAILNVGERIVQKPLAHWVWADSRLQLSGLSMALMALLLALAVNIGVSTMVGSFNSAFLRWLDGRLLADVYVAGKDNGQTREIETWLRNRPDVVGILPMARTETKIDSETIEIFGIADDPVYRDGWPLLDGDGNVWNALRDGTGVLVSEQLSRRLKLTPGSDIRIPLPTGSDWRVRVAGVYADYGNPKGQVSVNVDQLVARFPDADRTRLGLRVSPGSGPALISELERRFELTGRSLADQATVKAEARRIFGRTFAVTAALNAFTLGVAGIALLMSLLSLADARLPQLAPLWAMGVPGRTLAMLEFTKTVMLALLTALLALPLGLCVAWCLIEIVNVKAFGWRLPFSVFPLELVRLVIVAVLAACIASLIPIVRLARVRPAAFLKTFANES